ncbi:hypothetical protein DHEL01_v204356 [Diaporthe helianthi]|uniref:Secreted protein n=1 Tax=Diaporthe helianthi TaxID=158607 RepID=A0A2P5I425_DIAHE|nr:hypothetical protein DHEL01_v204356 [Diaporthe helianthi]
MAAPATSAAIALHTLTLMAYLYHRATHCRPYNGIPYSPHSTRRLSGDMPELTAAEVQPHWDKPRVILSRFEKHCSPGIRPTWMLFWRLLGLRQRWLGLMIGRKSATQQFRTMLVVVLSGF